MWFEKHSSVLKSLAIAAALLQFCASASAADVVIKPTAGSHETFLVLGGPDAGILHPPPGGWPPRTELLVRDIREFRDLTKKAQQTEDIGADLDMRPMEGQTMEGQTGVIPRTPADFRFVILPLEGSNEAFIVAGLSGAGMIVAPPGGWPQGFQIPVRDALSITKV